MVEALARVADGLLSTPNVPFLLRHEAGPDDRDHGGRHHGDHRVGCFGGHCCADWMLAVVIWLEVGLLLTDLIGNDLVEAAVHVGGGRGGGLVSHDDYVATLNVKEYAID